MRTKIMTALANSRLRQRLWIGNLVGFLFAFSSDVSHAESAVHIRFYPNHHLRVYEVDSRHGVFGALLQNAAVVNNTDTPVILDRVETQLLSAGTVLQIHRLTDADLEKAAKRGVNLEKASLLETYSFQFRPDILLGPDVHLATSTKVTPNTAILFPSKYFVFSGAADQLKVIAVAKRLDGTPVVAEASLPITMTSSENAYDFPLKGRWFVAVAQALHNPHRWVVPEEFALDLVKLGPNASTHKGKGDQSSDFYAFDEPVLATADGKVKTTQDSAEDINSNLQQPGETADAYQSRIMSTQQKLLAKGALAEAGNYVVLEHSGGEFSFYAHLRRGSVQVHPGDQVKRGQEIGRLGNSGNSTEPHLHFHVVDGPDPLLSAGIPVHFRNVVLPLTGEERALHDGDITETQ